METYDAVVVGGGPAGSSCAWRLHEAGLGVLVLDKRVFPRNKTCAGWITPQVVETLQIDTARYSHNHVCQPITGFRSGLIGGKEVETHYGRPISYGIRRCELDHFLLRRSGVPCRLGEAACSIQRRGDLWVVNDQIQTPMLVGAGGHFCPVARTLGVRERAGEAVVVAQEVEFVVSPGQRGDVSIAPQTPELFFCKDLLGYGWCFVKGDYLNIGLGRVDPTRLSAHVQAFCGFLRERKKVCCDIPPRFMGHAYQLYEGVKPKLIDDGVLLIGDAAGLAYPHSGEGIRPAVESGLLAAAVILEADRDYRRQRLTPYQATITSRLGVPHKHSLTDWLPASWLCHLASRLMATHWFNRHVVMDRWFLHAHQPALSL